MNIKFHKLDRNNINILFFFKKGKSMGIIKFINKIYQSILTLICVIIMVLTFGMETTEQMLDFGISKNKYGDKWNH